MSPEVRAMVESGVSEWAQSSDARVDGEELLVDPLAFFLGLVDSGAAELVLVEEGGEVAGYDISMPFEGWLMGCQTYLRPEFRGRGLWGRVADAMTRRALAEGLRGVCFCSTLPGWAARAARYGFRMEPISGEAVLYMKSEVS